MVQQESRSTKESLLGLRTSRRQFIKALLLSLFGGFVAGKTKEAQAQAPRPLPPDQNASPFDFMNSSGVSSETISSEISARVNELSLISDEVDAFTEKKQALELLFQLSAEGKLGEKKIPIGWIDMTPVYRDHPAFDGLDIVGDSIQKNESAVSNGKNLHATSALYLATQLGSGGEAGLSQGEWSSIFFINLEEKELPWDESAVSFTETEKNMFRFAEEIKDLVREGVGVIGTMPTWVESNLDGENFEDNRAVRAITEAFAFAAAHNVFIVIPAGNAGVDLGAVIDKRILHELVKKENGKKPYPNVLVAGGINPDLSRPTWSAGDESRGANYGEGYLDWVTLINRQVPFEATNFAQYYGTTFAVGEIVSVIQAVQSILRKNSSELPQLEAVSQCLLAATKDMFNSAEFGNGVIQIKKALEVAVQS